MLRVSLILAALLRAEVPLIIFSSVGSKMQLLYTGIYDLAWYLGKFSYG